MDWNKRQLFGAGTVIVFLLTIILAVSATPGYTVGSRWMSDLSISSGATFFVPGIILTGLLLLGFFFSEWKEQHFWRAKPLMTVAALLGAVASVALIAAGLFPASSKLHPQAGMVFFWLAGLTALAFFVLFAYDPDAKVPKRPVEAILGMSVIFVLSDLAFGLSQWRILDNSWLFPLEWLTVILFAVWILVLAWTPDEPIHHHA